MCVILLQALGDELRGVCTDYHAEPGLGLSCSVQLSATLPSVVDESVENQCVRLPHADPDVRLCPANTTHQYQVMHVVAFRGDNTIIMATTCICSWILHVRYFEETH